MSHFALRMGHFFHVDPFGLGHLVPSAILEAEHGCRSLSHGRSRVALNPMTCCPISACVRRLRAKRVLAELDRFSLTQREGESVWGPDETWLSLP